MSTGAACPRRSSLARGWAVPAELVTASHPGGRPEDPIQRRVTREQAYLPAEQPSPSQGSRFPPAHAHPRGPGDPVDSSPQGPQEPGGLTVAHSDPRVRVVLPQRHRLTNGESFRRTVRVGRRSGARTLVVHLDVLPESTAAPLQVGFVVSKAVGNAVIRNRVKRRLRHLCGEQLDGLPGSGALVVRALPAAATATSEELRADLVRCLQRVTRATASVTASATGSR